MRPILAPLINLLEKYFQMLMSHSIRLMKSIIAAFVCQERGIVFPCIIPLFLLSFQLLNTGGKIMSHIFGPVPSRRLGLSLGIDLVPIKTCSYNCIYCEVGKTTDLIMEPASFIDIKETIRELEALISKSPPDVITLAGSGEPTLNLDLGVLISGIKKITSIPVTLLTNGSLLFKEEVRERCRGVDIILPTLSSVFKKTYEKIHRPHPDLDLERIIYGLKEMRKGFKKDYFLEVMLLKGINDSDKELVALKKVIIDISPDRVQLNTVVRPPADRSAYSLTQERLEEIKGYFGGNTEVIAGAPIRSRGEISGAKVERIIEMIKRRPVTIDDISKSLNFTNAETEQMVTGLKIKGIIKEQRHGENLFYTSK
jgi:wyosine [tRNA(Phe)-imidazoG37] synthetase (radical SAM superfamily)